VKLLWREIRTPGGPRIAADAAPSHAQVTSAARPPTAARRVYTFSALVCSAILLTGCGLAATHEARDPLGSRSLIGMNVTDLITCAGVPDKTVKLTDEVLLMQWQTAINTKPAFTLTVPIIATLEIGNAGSCKMTAPILREGIVADVDFPGASASIWEGPYAACSDLVKECVLHRGSTSLPPGYDSFAVFLPTKP
jgi:hypothetical protein